MKRSCPADGPSFRVAQKSGFALMEISDMVYPRGNEDEPSPSKFAPTISPNAHMRWPRIFPMFIAFPALLQAQGGEVAPVIPPPIESEAREFMDDYADDLKDGRRLSIVDRYDKRGAYRV